MVSYQSYLVKTFLNFFDKKRRRRDLNPRTAINSLLPFQGSPFNHLGTSAWLRVILLLFTSLLLGKKEAERVGFEPTRPCGQTVFKTASL